ATQYCTVCCQEWVPEQYQCTRTVYRRECRQENYTAYKCVCVPETRCREICTYQMVPEYKTIVKHVCSTVPCVEERTIMQTCYKCVPYTTCVKRCVDHGHWECKWVPCCDNGGWRRFFRGHHHGCGNDCCNTCDSCNSCNSGCND